MIRALYILIAYIICICTQAQVIPDHSQEGNYFYPRPSYVSQQNHIKPTNLITKDSIVGRPLSFNFITDFPPPIIPGNIYIKPGNLVNSKPLFLKNRNLDVTEVLKKDNILYVPLPISRQYAERANALKKINTL